MFSSRNSLHQINQQTPKLISNRQQSQGFLPKLINPQECNKLKRDLFNKINRFKNQKNQLIVYRYQPTKSFYLSRGYKKQSTQFQRSKNQNEIIMSNFLLTYFNRKAILNNIDSKNQYIKYQKNIEAKKSQNKLSPGYIYKLNRSIKKKQRQIPQPQNNSKNFNMTFTYITKSPHNHQQQQYQHN